MEPFKPRKLIQTSEIAQDRAAGKAEEVDCRHCQKPEIMLGRIYRVQSLRFRVLGLEFGVGVSPLVTDSETVKQAEYERDTGCQLGYLGIYKAYGLGSSMGLESVVACRL